MSNDSDENSDMTACNASSFFAIISSIALMRCLLKHCYFCKSFQWHVFFVIAVLFAFICEHI